MPLNVNVDGTWRTASKVYPRVSGSWVTAKELWAYMSGGWQSAWKNGVTYINTSDRTSANIFELMGSPTQPDNYVFENQAAISAGTGYYALRTGVFPAGSTLKIINKGYIEGKGGDGGAYTGAGQPGGAALYLDMPCILDNSLGTIRGGGGGGGGAQQYNAPAYYNRAAGGGGAGANSGTPGTGTVGNPNPTLTVYPTAGTVTAGGVGGRIRIYSSPTGWSDSQGGAGGSSGMPGQNGSTSKGSSTPVTSLAYSGGAAGNGVIKNGNHLEIHAQGTLLGSVI